MLQPQCVETSWDPSLCSSGVDEQLVMKCAGRHRSTEGIRSYKLLVASVQTWCLPCPMLDPTAPSTAGTTAQNISIPTHLQTSSTDHAGAFYLSSCYRYNVNINY